MRKLTKVVTLYTAALLAAPLPAMPFAVGSREFAASVLLCAAILGSGSAYAAREMGRQRSRILVETKVLIASSMTLLFAIGMSAWALWFLWRGSPPGR